MVFDIVKRLLQKIADAKDLVLGGCCDKIIQRMIACDGLCPCNPSEHCPCPTMEEDVEKNGKCHCSLFQKKADA